MKIRSVIRKGSDHKVFCEDYLWHQENERFVAAAILDGCSTGKDSHFASAFYGKAIRSRFAIYGFPYNSIEEITKDILYGAICEVNILKSYLGLSTEELLSTIIFSIYDKKKKELFVIVIGDGLIVINEDVIEIDQNNTPDYLSYHIDKLINRNAFETWFENFENVFHYEDVRNFSICSDGILSFKTIKKTEEGERDPVEFFTKDEFLIHNPSMLARKCNLLEIKHGMIHQDDLSIIRLYNEPEKSSVDVENVTTSE